MVADRAGLAESGPGDLPACQRTAALRLRAATEDMISVHRDTLAELRRLDEWCTIHWVGKNVGNSVSAALSVAAAPLVFVLPPVGLGLGVAAAATAGASYAGDSIGERSIFAALTRQVSVDKWNALAHAELTHEWMRLHVQHGEALSSRTDLPGTFNATVSAAFGARAVSGAAEVGTGIGRAAARVTSAAVQGTRIASGVLSIAGSLVSTGVAIHGWSVANVSQEVLRAEVSELQSRLVRLHCLLHELDPEGVTCAICLEPIAFTAPLRDCGAAAHIFHAACIDAWLDVGPECPICRRPVEHNRPVFSFESVCREHLRAVTV